MTVVEELIRVENENGLSFGDYTLNAKKKVSDFEFHGDMYKVKTYRDITKLEKNELFVYESVPGTSVFDFEETDVRTEFEVEGFEDTQMIADSFRNHSFNPQLLLNSFADCLQHNIRYILDILLRQRMENNRLIDTI